MELFKIEALLEAYFEGNTSLAEESMLRDYFKNDEVAAGLKQYQPLFAGLEIARTDVSNRNIEIPWDKWFMNLSKVGNVGSASIFIMLEELSKSGKLKKGDKILLSVPESARFSYSYAYLTVC